MSSGARALLARALERRTPLREKGSTTAFRWVNGAGDGMPGLTRDLFGAVGVLFPHVHPPIGPKGSYPAPLNTVTPFTATDTGRLFW